ncbi:hypothetical protein CC86DRAFT_134829 [Ophiobolus disseminans]|uniref:F-box domain-containing protein n=1 Tax=Ophiobolus disseminans TaxID=1469910 RepID=A0A6A7ACR1_9PLEO|nr:hypothetical protein CC86DRAFT_134829 [Ophiobolus disseminans]
MAPSIHAGIKRRGDELEGNPNKRTQMLERKAQNIGARTAEPDGAACEIVQDGPSARCRLLELPSELRNRIYDFATEDFIGEGLNTTRCSDDCDCGCEEDFDKRGAAEPPYRWAPRTRPSHRPTPTTWWADRPWQFYGLTQVCAQLRAEFKPLWIRALEVRLTLTTLPGFVETFLWMGAQHVGTQPIGAQTMHAPKSLRAPKLIQIAWHHDSDNQPYPDQLDPLLKFHTLCPEFRFAFVPFDITDLKTMPGDAHCEHCLEMNERFGYDESWNDEDCECVDPDLPYQDWIYLEEDRIAYTGILQAFLHNDNKTWANDILDEKITAQRLGMTNSCATFKILCKKSFCHSVRDLQGAWDLLKGWGIIDLPRKAQMEIILAFEESETAVIDGYKVTNSLVREFRVPQASVPRAT